MGTVYIAEYLPSIITAISTRRAKRLGQSEERAFAKELYHSKAKMMPQVF